MTTWRSHIIPLVVVLTERKTTATYRSVLRALRQVSPNFDPDTVVTDFELAQLRAWGEIFPRASRMGCFFHYVSVSVTFPVHPSFDY